MLREKLCKLAEIGSLHDYLSTFQNVLVPCQILIPPLELRFYFQQGLRSETSHHLREHYPFNLDDATELPLQFDHSVTNGSIPAVMSEWEKAATCHKCREVGHIASKCPKN
eukprot:jgi/Phyca11/4576/fgenesh1_pm.PHYCAscaffold_2_\